MPAGELGPDGVQESRKRPFISSRKSERSLFDLCCRAQCAKIALQEWEGIKVNLFDQLVIEVLDFFFPIYFEVGIPQSTPVTPIWKCTQSDCDGNSTTNLGSIRSFLFIRPRAFFHLWKFPQIFPSILTLNSNMCA